MRTAAIRSSMGNIEMLHADSLLQEHFGWIAYFTCVCDDHIRLHVHIMAKIDIPVVKVELLEACVGDGQKLFNSN